MLRKFLKEHPEIWVRLKYESFGVFWIVEMYSLYFDHGRSCVLQIAISDQEIEALNVSFEDAIGLRLYEEYKKLEGYDE